MSDGYEITEPAESLKEQADASESSREAEENAEISRGIDQTVIEPESVIEQEGDYKQAEDVMNELTDLVTASDSIADSPDDNRASDHSDANSNEEVLTNDASDLSPSVGSNEVETVTEEPAPDVLVQSDSLDSAAGDTDKKLEVSAPVRTEEDQATSKASEVPSSPVDFVGDQSPHSEGEVKSAQEANIEGSDITENIQENQRTYGKIVAQAWTDNEFKENLIADPRRVLTENGLIVPEEMEVKILEDTDERIHLILPNKPPAQLSEQEIVRPSIFVAASMGSSTELADGDFGRNFLNITGAFQSGHPVEEGQIGDLNIDNSNQIEELGQTPLRETRHDETLTEAHRIYSKIVAQSWADENFKSELLSDPKSVLAEHGSIISENVEVLVFENTENVGHLLIAREPSDLSSDKLMGDSTVSFSFSSWASSYLNEP